MKKLIRSNEYILGMSFDRTTAKHKIQNLAPIIEKHLIECIVYSNMKYLTVNHWINELATWMHALDKISYKNPKEKDYNQWLFNTFGTSEDDAFVNLSIYKADNESSNKPYPSFQVTDELAHEFCIFCKKFKEACLPMLLDKKTYSTEEWKITLLSLL